MVGLDPTTQTFNTALPEQLVGRVKLNYGERGWLVVSQFEYGSLCMVLRLTCYSDMLAGKHVGGTGRWKATMK